MEEKEIIERLEENKKFPKEIKNEIMTQLFQCTICAIIVYVYFIFLRLGEKNIHKNIYLTDLKVFATSFAILSVVFFENAYKYKDSKKMVIGIEILVLAIITLIIQYIVLYLTSKYIIIIPVVAIIYNVYFILKALLICHNIKIKYKSSLSDIKEIVKTQPKHLK